MHYKYDSKEYTFWITKIVPVNKKMCLRQKEIGRNYFSEIDRAGQGISSENIDSDKVNKLYLGDNTPRLENKFFFYKGDVITIYTFEKYGFTFSKFGVCSFNGKTIKC